MEENLKKDMYIIYMYTYMTLNRNRPSDIENSLMVTKRERWEGDKFGVWI